MVDYGAQTLVFELPSRPERVWEALTDPVALNQWFGETNFHARAGLPFALRPYADGDLPAGAGEVVAAEPPRRLVMRWRTGGRVLALTILVEPGPRGTVLRVAYSDTGGLADPAVAALGRLYDERLRSFLATGPLADPAAAADAPPRPATAPGAPTLPPPPTNAAPPPPPPADPAPPADPPPADPPAAPATAPVPAATRTRPAPTTSAAGPADGQNPDAREPEPGRRRSRAPLAIGAVVVALLLVAGWTVAGTPLTWGAPGPAPSSAQPSTAVASTAVATTAVATSAAPTGSASSAAAGPVTVASQVTNREPNSLTVTVTLTNRTSTGRTWRNVAVALTPTNAVLSNVDGRVNYQWAGTRACFTPGPAVTTIAAGATITFPFTVTGSAPAISGVSLDQPDCG